MSAGRARRPASARWCALLVLCLLAALASRAWADADGPVYGRVLVARAPLRSGPGAGFRILQVAERDDSYRVIGRASRGHWLKVALSDGSEAYVQGDALWLYGADEGERPAHERYRIFAPPPLLHARGELAVMLGSLSGSGFMALRPVYMLAPSFGFELNLGASVGSTGRLYFAGAGAIVNVFPSWPVTPFFALGGGGARALPNQDAFIYEAGGRSLAYAGGGLRFGFKRRLIVRVEARGYALFDADHLTSQQEISGGLSAFF